MSLSIEDLPHPVIEYIFSYLSPYRDLKQCLLVNKTWYDLVKGAVRSIRREFHNSVTARNVCWEHRYAESTPTISRRYSHSSCICRDSMFVFGGCTTASTTFNDLWRLDLGCRIWIRPLATGTYPPPKACASMVCYSDSLILFGGWTHTSPYPLHQAWLIFNHLHIYNTVTNRWTQVTTSSSCPGMAGHTATMIGSKMVVFGGLHCQSGWGPFASSNEVWVLDVTTMSWKKQKTSSPAPHPRYGHSQITVDNNHLLIVGGCGGPNMLFNDIWLLKTSDDVNGIWEWKEIEIHQKDCSAPQLTFHPACLVGTKVVVLSKAQWSRTLPPSLPQLLRAPSSRLWIPPQGEIFARPDPIFPPKPAENEACVNGKKGVLKRYLSRSLARKGGSNTSSSDDDETRGDKQQPPKKGISTLSTSNEVSVASTSRDNGATNIQTDNVKLTKETFEKSPSLPSMSLGAEMSVPVVENHSLASNLDTFSTADLIPHPTLSRPVSESSSSSSSSAASLSDAPASSSTSTSPVDNLPIDKSGPRLTLSGRPNARRNRQRQLEGLDRMEQRLRQMRSNSLPRRMIPKASTENRSLNSAPPKNPMCLYVLDISRALDSLRVTWLPPQYQSNSGLEEIILYSLVLGKGELVMFGGIQKDLNSYNSEGEKVPQIVSNSLHFISAFKYVI